MSDAPAVIVVNPSDAEAGSGAGEAVQPEPAAPVAAAAVEIAVIEAERDIQLAEIQAEARREEQAAWADERVTNLERELLECRTLLESRELRCSELEVQVLELTSLIPPPSEIIEPPSPPPEPEASPAESPAESPAANPEPAPEPPPKPKRRLNWI